MSEQVEQDREAAQFVRGYSVESSLVEDALVRDVTAAITAAREAGAAAERERCCKAICKRCAMPSFGFVAEMEDPAPHTCGPIRRTRNAAQSSPEGQGGGK